MNIYLYVFLIVLLAGMFVVLIVREGLRKDVPTPEEPPDETPENTDLRRPQPVADPQSSYLTLSGIGFESHRNGHPEP